MGPVATDSDADAAATRAMDHVREVVSRSRSSFLLAMRLLPAARRQAMYAVYAFCREVDDIADGDASEKEKRDQLAAWRADINRLFDGEPQGPVARALMGPVARYGLRREDFLAVIDGMEMDAEPGIQAPSWQELELYCARVAGAVGRLSVRIFGASGSRADDVARALGEALQLTNILRDVQEDAGEGRLYLPRELLQKHGINSRDPREVLDHPALPKVCRELSEKALLRFSEAQQAIADCDRRAMKPALVMMHVYRRILDRLIARGWAELDRPVKVSKLAKLVIGLRFGTL
ncbi:MAG: presqualene diphosphate synthase HpnD [Sphingomonadales bacterium]